jgi:hypothetical protein
VPACGANGRDRFLHSCFTNRVGLHPALRIMECSPRLGEPYRAAMSTWFFYRASDYDLRAHKGNLQLDLQRSSHRTHASTSSCAHTSSSTCRTPTRR